MIEIKNKRMILFPEDRLIGAQGDINTAKRQFVLDRVQEGYDLSDMVAWIKIDPIGSGKEAYDQMLGRKTVGERMILTWTLSGANLKDAGEISAQIIMASPDYFNADDLKNLSDTDLVVPSRIEGVSAPVWQSYRETFVIEESIDGTTPYEQVPKNVLVGALADAVHSAAIASDAAQEAVEARNNVEIAHEDITNKVNDAALLYNKMCDISETTEEYMNRAGSSSATAAQNAQLAVEARNNVEIAHEDITNKVNDAALLYSKMCDISETVEECMSQVSDSSTTAAQNAQLAESAAQTALEKARKAQECLDEVEICLKDTYDYYELSARNAEQTNAAVRNVNATANRLQKARDYRLIYSKTLTEEETDCISFEITEDTEGNPLHLSEFVFYLYIPAMAEVGSTYLKVEVQGAGNVQNGERDYSHVAQFSGIQRTTNSYCRVECMQLGRWVAKVGRGTSWDQNVESINVVTGVCSRNRGIDGKAATAVRIVQHYNVGIAFPAGTFVEMWGADSLSEQEGATAE